MARLADPSYTAAVKSTYGVTFVEEMAAGLSDMVNIMSAAYANTDWGSAIGTIQVVFAALEYSESYTGDYAGLEPSISTDSGGRDSVSSDDYLSTLETWQSTTRPGISFDALLLISEMAFGCSYPTFG